MFGHVPVERVELTLLLRGLVLEGGQLSNLPRRATLRRGQSMMPGHTRIVNLRYFNAANTVWTLYDRGVMDGIRAF